MKIIYLTDDVSQSMCDIVISTINEESEITFYLNSQWWRAQYARCIVDAINKNKDRITLIATHEISSAAFRIFFLSKCKREILDDTEWLAHMGRIDVRMDWNKETSSIDNWRVKEMRKEEDVQEKLLKSLWVSKRNRKLFLKWYDIYFNTKSLRKMLKKQENE